MPFRRTQKWQRTLAEPRTPIENRYLSPCGMRVHLLGVNVVYLILACEGAVVSVSLAVFQRDIHSSHARPAPTENEFNKTKKKMAQPLCERRTYEYHCVHTHNFRFSFSIFIWSTFSQLQVRRIFVSDTRTTRHDENSMEVRCWVAKSQSCSDVCLHSLLGPF